MIRLRRHGRGPNTPRGAARSFAQFRAALVGAVVASLLAAAPGRADFFATLDVPPGPGAPGQRLEVVNVTTGAFERLPPGVDDPAASEVHPALSPDGRYLVFERVLSGTVRIVMVERSTGRSADLFSGFEAAADPPNTPTFSLDGTKVVTGRRLDHRDPASPPGALQSSFTETDVTSFPTGPFPHRIVLAGGSDSTAPGRTLQAVPFGSNLLAFGITSDLGSPPARITVQGPSGATTLSNSTLRLADPAVSDAAGVVVFDLAPVTSATTKLVFRPLAGIATAATTGLPALVNASDTSVRDPAFTRDGRYLAFVRVPTALPSSARLFIWDTQTQLLVNPTGTGVFLSGPDPTDGAIALEVRRVFTSTTVLTGGSVGFSLASGSTTGLLVQRIVGRHKVLGSTAPRLNKVGRVPLGRFGKGRHSRHWNLKVGGHKLRNGCYLVTFRALTGKGKVRDLSTPYTVRVRDRKHPLVRRGVRLRTCGRLER
jgi:WD40 repeat protein